MFRRMSTPARLISILLGAALGLQTLALGLHAHQHDATSESPTCAHSCGGSHATPTDDDRTTPPPTDDGDSCLICL
ncbi:MAG: hypothetical protein KDA28_00500, partial [Phycisphaerales bacterium]|nr:hypothetical protein [Phycisphaerales bacterium]